MGPLDDHLGPLDGILGPLDGNLGEGGRRGRKGKGERGMAAVGFNFAMKKGRSMVSF